jgi:hypothetical protein
MALQDVESNVQTLRNYIDEFSSLKDAIEEFKILPRNTTGAIRGFRDDVNMLRKILRKVFSTNSPQGIRWIKHRKRVEDIKKRFVILV